MSNRKLHRYLKLTKRSANRHSLTPGQSSSRLYFCRWHQRLSGNQTKRLENLLNSCFSSITPNSSLPLHLPSCRQGHTRQLAWKWPMPVFWSGVTTLKLSFFFLTQSPAFSCTGTCKLCSQFCLPCSLSSVKSV